MRFFILFLLMATFAYAIALFFTNTQEIAVDLLFTQIPAMNTAILLVITFLIGLGAGLLLALLVFRVFQMRWENGRLKKEVEKLRKEQIELATQAATASTQVEKPVESETPKSIASEIKSVFTKPSDSGKSATNESVVDSNSDSQTP